MYYIFIKKCDVYECHCLLSGFPWYRPFANKEGTEPEFPGAEVEFITLEVLRYVYDLSKSTFMFLTKLA
jgi:hypothetical protein